MKTCKLLNNLSKQRAALARARALPPPSLSSAGVAAATRGLRARGRRFVTTALLLHYARCLRAAFGRVQATRTAREQDLLLQSDGRAHTPRASARRWPDAVRSCIFNFLFFIYLYFIFFFWSPPAALASMKVFAAPLFAAAALQQQSCSCAFRVANARSTRGLRARGRRFATAVLLLRFTCCLRAAGGRAQATRKAQEQDCCCKATATRTQATRRPRAGNTETARAGLLLQSGGREEWGSEHFHRG